MSPPIRAPQEPLAESAPFARQLAQATCHAACGAYHGYWQYLRLMGLGKTLSGLPTLFVDAVREAAAGWEPGARRRRLLISGCADYSALAHVIAGCEQAGVRPRIVALDLCETPLIMSRWYARRAGWTIETACSDVLDFSSPEPFDLMVTSSFFGYFSPPQRQRLFANYARLLAPGGIFAFANRLRPGREDVAAGFSPAEAQAFADRAEALSQGLPAAASLEPAAARELAVAYASALASYPLNGEEAVRKLAEGAGLEWHAGGVQGTAPLQNGVSGPTMGDGAQYVFAQLRKPA